MKILELFFPSATRVPISKVLCAAAVLIGAGTLPEAAKAAERGTVTTESIDSVYLRDTVSGVDPKRTIKVYLPPDYHETTKSYPVIYYLHSLNWSAPQMFEDGNLQNLLERGVAAGLVKPFIFVAADHSTPHLGSWYENSPTTGRWLDFTLKEVVPFIDERFRTIRHRNSRGLAGDFVGGRGALKLAMQAPEVFSVVYALHPVATGTGWVPMASHPNWQKIHQAKSFEDLGDDGRARAYLSFHQAFLPNPDRPPFYCDFMVELENGKPKFHVENARKVREAFLLDHTLEDHAANLRTMRAIGFDWARYDPGQDHVYANQAFTRKLDEHGIEHEAEEYRGDPWNQNWTPHGRFYARVLPFFGRHLVFDPVP